MRIKTVVPCLFISLFIGCAVFDPYVAKLIPAKDVASNDAVGSDIVIKNDSRFRADVVQYRNNKPEQIAIDASKNMPPKSIRDDHELRLLVASLIKDSTDEFIKVKRLHDWVALSISYDAVSFFSENLPDQTPFAVLQRGIAVCSGYANLFEKMCSLANIRVRTIHGYARGYGSDAAAIENPKDTNHAWNIVNIKNYWYPVDCTWDSGHLDGKKSIKDYSTAYFLLDPEYMKYTHFPEDSYYQLLNNPINAAEFSELPYLDGPFFDAVLSGYEGTKKKLAINDLYQFNLITRPGTVFSTRLIDSKSKKEEPFVFSQNGENELNIAVGPPKGNYVLELFFKSTKTFTRVAEWVIESSIVEPIYAPVVYQKYAESKSKLLSPAMKNIKAGEQVLFSIMVPGAQKVFAVQGNSRTNLDKVDDHFTKIIGIANTTKIDIFGVFDSKSNSGEGLLSFRIVK